MGNFPRKARAALRDVQLQRALMNVKRGFIAKREKAKAKLPEFDQLRDDAREIKLHSLANLDQYLSNFSDKVRAAGGHPHRAKDGAQACKIILDICRNAQARTVTKGKSMISEEMELNAYLQDAGLEVIETDLGEYIIQLRGERPSHIIAPAVHLNAAQVEADFRKKHVDLPPDRIISEPPELVSEARAVLRQHFLKADVGITGANFLIAETGQSVIVTNEGNGDLTRTLPRVHIIVASIEKILPTLEDASLFIRLLARSATGQEITTYTTFAGGSKRASDPDGPEQFHVVLLDNGRSEILGGQFHDMLACIRCGACLNHCPVYQAVGGHAYGSVYPGPMGSVLTPLLKGIEEARHLPHACTLCGRCQAICPVRIPLPRMLRAWRVLDFEQKPLISPMRLGLKFWAFFARRPALYRLATSAAARLLPRTQGRTFQSLWQEKNISPSPAPVTTAKAGTHRKDTEKTLHHTIPARGQVDLPGRVALMRKFLEGQNASVAEADGMGAVPGLVAEYLRGQDLPLKLRMGADDHLAALDWSGLETSTGRARNDDLTGLSMAFCAIAETGTCMLLSGADNPTTLNFMPDNHIIIVHKKDILGVYEQGWNKLRKSFGDDLPNTINYISGPSRTADIEQTIQLGAHGPRRLHVILAGDEEVK